MITAKRYHDFSCGHTVTGHESKCAHLHGHNYRVYFEVAPDDDLDEIGRVMDFSVIKEKLCMWLEENWDHKFLVFIGDKRADLLYEIDPNGVVIVPFNPTAENMAGHLANVGARLLRGTNCSLVSVVIEETRKCSVEWNRNQC